MFRRLPSPFSVAFAATLGLFVLASVLTAQPPPAADVKPADIKRTQEENKKRYSRLTTDILKLAQRWEKSDNPADQERAKTLRAVLKLADERGLDNLFKQLVEGIGNKGANTGDVGNLINNDKKLIAALEDILNTLDTEDEAAIIHRDILKLEALKKEVERIKREQELTRARTENPRSDTDKVAKDQNNLAKQTQDIANKMSGKDPKGNPNVNANKADDKSDPKPEGKPGEASPEAKPDTNENKSDSKDGGKPMGDAKSGSESRESPKGTEAGSSKDSPKDGPMAGEPKAGEPKAGEPKAGEPKGAKPGESKDQGQGKGDTKPSDSKSGAESKPMTSKEGGQPSASKPNSGSPSSGQPKSGQPSDSQSGPQKPTDQAQENIQQAVPQQKGAEEDIRKNDRQEASKKQDKAIQSLEEAIKELEKRLKQLREKELAKLLGTLEERVTRMLRMQEEVYEATKAIDRTIKKNKNVKTNADHQRAQVESDREDAIVAEADKTLKLMEGEGTAVVFAGVLSEVKGDMIAVKKRLEATRVEGRGKADQAEGTQLIEEGIIEQLKMMKEALKKAKQDLENSMNKPSESAMGQPNKKLIDLINELKLIKSLQEQVNKRTISYSKQDPGEQAKDPLIQGELKQLSDRQKVLQEMLHKIATEANQ